MSIRLNLSTEENIALRVVIDAALGLPAVDPSVCLMPPPSVEEAAKIILQKINEAEDAFLAELKVSIMDRQRAASARNRRRRVVPT